MRIVACLLAVVAAGFLTPAVEAGNPRSEAHQKFVATLWKYVQEAGYQTWPQVEQPPGIGVGPWFGQKIFAMDKGEWAAGSTLISEHWAEDALSGISVFVKQKEGYSDRNKDWYWAHFAADGTVVSAIGDKERFRKPGFVSWEIDGRLWVFVMTSRDAADFAKSGDLAKNVTRPAAGPDSMTIRSADSKTNDAWVASKGGFFVKEDEGRLWVFRSDDPALAKFLAGIEPAKMVIRPGAGPGGATLKALDAETIAAYLAAKDGFVTFIVEGRIWVFRTDAPERAEFRAGGEIAKNVPRPGAGPDGMTVRAPDAETLDAYLD